MEWFLILALAFLISLLLRFRHKREQEKHGKNWPEVQFARTNKFRTVTWIYIALFFFVWVFLFVLGTAVEGFSLEGALAWFGILLFFLFFLFIALIPNWIYNDAKKRGMENAAEWANSVGLTGRLWPFVYLVGYLQERKKFPIAHKTVKNSRENISLE